MSLFSRSQSQPSFSARVRQRDGQALIMVTGSLMFTFATMGLAIDFGWSYYLKMRVQTAADAAATSAAVYAMNHGETCATVSCGVAYNCVGTTPPTSSLQAGCLYATQDGPPSMTASMIQNNTAPPGVTGNSPAMWIKSMVSTTAPTGFLFAMGNTTTTIAAQSYAGVTADTSAAANCVYALSTTGTGFYATGSNTLTSDCGIFVNSNLSVDGSNHITASTIQYKGSYSNSGSNIMSPTPTHVTTLVADPLASVPSPTVPNTCDHTNFSSNKDTAISITAGTYCGGISLSGSGAVTFGSGIYIINGGGFNVSGSSHLNGTDVMFYFTGKYGQTAKGLNFSGSQVVNLVPTTSGSYKGIIFYQDRSVFYSTSNRFDGSNSAMSGTLYFPGTAVYYTGSNTGTYTAIVANTITFDGSGNFKKDLTGTHCGLVRPSASLIQ